MSLQTGDDVHIRWFDYVMKGVYLAANTKEDIPKKLADEIGIPNINSFVHSVLGYSQHGWKIFGFRTVADAIKLIDALKNYDKDILITKESSMNTSSVLNKVEQKAYFENTVVVENLSTTNKNLNATVNSFNSIAELATKIANKVKEKNSVLVSSIDNSNVTKTKELAKECKTLLTYVESGTDVLTTMADLSKAIIESTEATEFNAEKFLSDED